MERTSRRIAALFAFCVAAATSVARPPDSPDEMAAETERWLVEGAGARFLNGMASPASDGDFVFVDETWPPPFQERVGESIALRISPDTGCYEFADSDGTVFWTVVPVAPLTWNWISPFRSPLRPDTQNLYSPFRLAREWLLLSPSESDSRAESAEPLATRRSSLATRGAAALATNLCFTAFSYTETNLFFTAAWPTNEALPESVLDLYGSTNLSSRWTLLSSHPATTNPVSFAVVRAALPWYVEPTQHVHDASCVSLTNVVLSPLDGVTVYTNAFWSCSTNREYPEYTATGSEYDDTVSWTVVAGNSVVASGTTDVNALHGRFAAADAAGHAIGEMTGPPVDLGWKLLSAPVDSDLSVQVSFCVVNVADDLRPTTILAALYPLKVVQANWPKSDTATDNGDRNPKRILRDGVAYVTGEPAAPALTAKFQGLPGFVEVGWKLDLVTEREKRENHDNRRVPATGWIEKNGDEAWDIEAALNEIVGGKNTLSMRVKGEDMGDFSHFIRGKNPLDEDVESFLANILDTRFRNIVGPITRHENRQGNYIYNQFNARVVNREQPNLGDPDGWGIAQLDRSRQEGVDTTTAEVWNWKTNLVSMAALLVEKRNMHLGFISLFRAKYGTHTNWVEPPSSYEFIPGSNIRLAADEWAEIVLYNGAGGVPWTTLVINNSTNRFRSPWVFLPNETNVNRRWTFHDNGTNYAQRISFEIQRGVTNAIQ